MEELNRRTHTRSKPTHIAPTDASRVMTLRWRSSCKSKSALYGLSPKAVQRCRGTWAQLLPNAVSLLGTARCKAMRSILNIPNCCSHEEPESLDGLSDEELARRLQEQEDNAAYAALYGLPPYGRAAHARSISLQLCSSNTYLHAFPVLWHQQHMGEHLVTMTLVVSG